jgi:hypothetical protein
MRKTMTLLLILLTALGPAQDAKADFKKINWNYYEAKQLTMDVNYDLFFDNDAKASDSESGVYKRNKDNYYVKQGGNEVLITDKHILVVDHGAKTMIVDNSKGKINPINPLKVDLDSIFHFYEKVEFYKTGAANELSAYRFHFKRGLYQYTEVVFDAATFYVKEIVNVYREKMPDASNINRKARLRISFANINPDPKFTTEFKESNYVSSRGGKIIPLSRYANYKLLTNLKKL